MTVSLCVLYMYRMNEGAKLIALRTMLNMHRDEKPAGGFKAPPAGECGMWDESCIL
jgi:hypothetical protein